jgi:hypothetical protein
LKSSRVLDDDDEKPEVQEIQQPEPIMEVAIANQNRSYSQPNRESLISLEYP